ncbi:hypothetical protein WJX72_002547 [[Myrmecia] bisecta]|uniref:SAP domain-containing protein n=1 Tax=[Myrmecia] bisecta TaxID=41462 RepID=A0AAW1QPP4_9CHLO
MGPDAWNWLRRSVTSQATEEATEAENFRGLDYVREAAERMQRQAELAALQQLDETDPERTEYNRQLGAAARQGRPSDAEAVLAAMQDAGLPPGPRAYHGLVYAYARANDAAGALAAVQREYQELRTFGLQPLAETYAVLIHALVAEGKVPEAHKVYESMQQAGVNPRPGWLVLTCSLFSKGHKELATKLVQQGLRNQWVPDSDLYEHIIRELCEQGKVEAAQATVFDMQARGVAPLPKHCNPVVRALSLAGTQSQALELLRQIPTGPNADTFNGLLEGLVHTKAVDAESLNSLKAQMATAGQRANKRTWALLVEANLELMDCKAAMDCFGRMTSCMERGGQTEALSDASLLQLLQLLSSKNMPEQITRVLRFIAAEKRRLPSSSEQQAPHPEDRTFLTEWLAAHRLEMRTVANKPTAGLVAQNEEAARTREVEGVLIGAGDCAVNEDGSVISVSKLTVGQMRAELTARGLSVDGKRKDLYKRVQAARRNAPTDVIGELKKKEAKKKAKDEKAKAKALAEEGVEDKASTSMVVNISYGKVTERAKEESTASDEADDDNEEEEEEEVEEAVRPQGSINYDEDAEDEDEVSSSKSRQRGAAGQSAAAKKASSLAAVMQMLQMTESLGGRVSVGDLQEIHKAAAAEDDFSVVQAVARRLHNLEGGPEFTEIQLGLAGRLLNDVAMACLTGGDSALALELVGDMERLRFTPSEELQAGLRQLEVAGPHYEEDM